MTVKETITHKLATALSPEMIEVVDESHHHAGHGGWREGGETHFRINVVAEAFRGKSRVECHRMVNTILADDLANGIHALAMTTKAP